jgi:hypothetical protein
MLDKYDTKKANILPSHMTYKIEVFGPGNGQTHNSCKESMRIVESSSIHGKLK